MSHMPGEVANWSVLDDPEARRVALPGQALAKPDAHNLTRRSRRAFPMTDSELKVMAAAAIIGLRRTPKKG